MVRKDDMEEKEKPNVNEEESKVENDDDILDPDDFEDDEEDEEEPAKAEETESEKEKEEKAKNAKAAERRRKREEREAKIREEAKLNAELGILKVNPYTEEPITDEEDLKIYKLQKELDDEGKDPINDLPKRIAENARKSIKEAKDKEENARKEEKERMEKINNEIKELVTKYPKVNTSELANDPLFQKCLEGRAGRWSQVEIYELYLREKADAEKKAKEEEVNKKVEETAKKVTKTPSSNAKGNSPQKTIEEMSDEEFERYFQEKYN